nr:putative reverse transcriptase domain-containing protein [Tanacetum cinerariifolium]
MQSRPLILLETGEIANLALQGCSGSGEFKKLKRSRIAIVKVQWNSKRGPEFTWKREYQMKPKSCSDVVAFACVILSLLLDTFPYVNAPAARPLGVYDLGVATPRASLDEVKGIIGDGCYNPSKNIPMSLGAVAIGALLVFRAYCPGIRSFRGSSLPLFVMGT